MQNEDSAGHQNWISTLTDARENCREALASAMVEVPDPSKTRWPVKHRNNMSWSHKAALRAHVSVIDYADLLEPYEKEAGGLWTSELTKIDLTPNDAVAVSLDDLEEWEALFIEATEKKEHELEGHKVQTKQQRILLPVNAGRRCYRQLNRVVKELNFAAELPTGDYKEVEPI